MRNECYEKSHLNLELENRKFIVKYLAREIMRNANSDGGENLLRQLGLGVKNCAKQDTVVRIGKFNVLPIANDQTNWQR